MNQILQYIVKIINSNYIVILSFMLFTAHQTIESYINYERWNICNIIDNLNNLIFKNECL